MAPNVTSTVTLVDNITIQPTDTKNIVETVNKKYEWDIRWRNVLAFVYLHSGFLYGLYLSWTAAQRTTTIWGIAVGLIAGIGITGGAHRLWAHRTYKAKWPLRLLLAMLQTIAFQNHIYEWSRDHRVHHKFCDTDADPHNSSRGFFFSHMGWLMLKKHPDVKLKGKSVDMSDLEADPIVMWQKKLFPILMPVMCFALPVMIPMALWGEKFYIAWHINLMRYTMSLHMTWLVNSAAHIWGTKPYDRSISPTQSIPVSVMALGEGWHNYHHVFPWDYKAAELGDYRMNVTTAFIDFFARIGWAYDLKMVPEEMAAKRAARTGDGSHQPKVIWGWGDKDMPQSEIKEAEIIHHNTKEHFK